MTAAPADPPVYFDHNATTPPDPRVVEAMLPWLGTAHGNPSSVHAWGQRARGAVEEARAEVAALIGAEPLEVVFTASGTEANNAVLRGWFADRHGHLVISTLEHPSITETARWLESQGVAVSRVAPDPDGTVDPARIEEALRDDTRLVALMLANNEIGTVQPVAEVAARCRRRGIATLCDGVQAVGKIPVDCRQLEVDFLTLAAHKFHGPLGAAALWLRTGLELPALLLGGGQERRRRAGTENVAAVVGFGRACELARRELDERRRHLRSLRDRFETGLARLVEVEIHGRGAQRLPHTSLVAFDGIAGAALVIRLDLAGFAVSTGAACSSGAVAASPALVSMGIAADQARASVRFSFGVPNTLAEVDALLPVLEREVEALRGRRVGTPVGATSP